MEKYIKVDKIFVKELPKHCCECPFSKAWYHIFTCIATGKEREDYNGMKRMRGYPLKLSSEYVIKKKVKKNDNS